MSSEKLEYTHTRSPAYEFGSPLPDPQPPEGDGWYLVSHTVEPALTLNVGKRGVGSTPSKTHGVVLYTWARPARRKSVEPCPGLPGRACGGVAVRDGVCLGCGQAREQ